MEKVEEVTILSDWVCNGENQKGKTGKWNTEYLNEIKIEYIHSKRKQDVRKLQSESDSITK